jgi:hypothetical protein
MKQNGSKEKREYRRKYTRRNKNTEGDSVENRTIGTGVKNNNSKKNRQKNKTTERAKKERKCEKD